jgi:hypothetical protein
MQPLQRSSFDQVMLNVEYFAMASKRSSCTLLAEDTSLDFMPEPSDLFDGVLMVSSLEASSGMKHVLATVGCLVVLIDGQRNGTWLDVGRTVNDIDVARKLVLITRATQDVLEHLANETRSFDTMFINETGKTGIHR